VARVQFCAGTFACYLHRPAMARMTEGGICEAVCSGSTSAGIARIEPLVLTLSPRQSAHTSKECPL
jgi:hypothetical protein